MIYASMILFFLGASVGLIMVFSFFRNKNTSRILVYGHALLVLSGLVLLIITTFRESSRSYALTTIVFLITATIGVVMYFYDNLLKKPIPIALIPLHIFMATIGLALILTLVILLFARNHPYGF